MMLALMLLAGQAPLSPELQLVFGLGFLVAFVASHRHVVALCKARIAELALAGVALLAGVAFLFGPPGLRVVGMALTASALCLAIDPDRAERNESLLLTTSLALSAAYGIIVRVSPEVWAAANAASLWASRLVQHPCHQLLGLGVCTGNTFLAEPLSPFVILAIVLVLWPGGGSVRSRLRRAALCGGLLLLATAAYLVCAATVALLVQNGAALRSYHDPEELRHLVLLLLPQVLQAFLLMALWIIARIYPPAPLPARGQAAWPPALCALCLALASLLVLLALLPGTRAGAPSRATGQVAVLMQHSLADFRSAAETKYHALEPRAFGGFRLLLQCLGYSMRVVERFDGEALSNANLLVIARLNRDLSIQERATVWQFVQTGGQLVVMGTEGVEWSNRLLEPTGIRFRGGDAVHLTGYWSLGLRSFADPLGRQPVGDLQIAGGPGLKLARPARALLVGRYGFQDSLRVPAGVTWATIPRRYQSGQPLGDMVLAAEQRLGRGRTLVITDAWPASDAALADNWEWLGRAILRPPIAGPRRSGPIAWLAPAQPEPRPEGPIAYLDLAHMPRSTKPSWRSNGDAVLRHELLRNGRLPLGLSRFDPVRLMSASMLICLDPGKRYTAHELSHVEAFAAQGGKVILTAGQPTRAGSGDLLRAFGMRLGERALGSVTLHAQGQPTVAFSAGQAWPLVAAGRSPHNYWPLLSTEAPQVVAAATGVAPSGCFIAIGDPYALFNRNLGWSYSPESRHKDFIRWLCDWRCPIAPAGGGP